MTTANRAAGTHKALSTVALARSSEACGGRARSARYSHSGRSRACDRSADSGTSTRRSAAGLVDCAADSVDERLAGCDQGGAG